MPRRRTITATRVTEHTTTTVTEEWTEPVHWAPGDPHLYPDEPRYRQQRVTQAARCQDFLAAAADDGHTALDHASLRQAVTILRALPGSSCMEAEHGRTL